MKFKSVGGSVIDFEFPHSFQQGDARQSQIKAEIAKIDTLLHDLKHDTDIVANKARGKAHKRKRELQTELTFFRLWRSEIGQRENSLMLEAQEYEDSSVCANFIAAALHQAIHLENAKRIPIAGQKSGYRYDPIDTHMLRTLEAWIRNRLADEISEDIPESFIDLLVDCPAKPTPTVNKSAVWDEIKGLPIRAAVNMVRHRHTNYDSDRFKRPYLVAFTSANMWIADNFPQLADEAIAQIDEKMALGGKRIRPSGRFALQSS